MNTSTNRFIFVQRGVSFCLAAMITLSLLGGIDQLAQHPAAAADANWAANVTTASTSSTAAATGAARG